MNSFLNQLTADENIMGISCKIKLANTTDTYTAIIYLAFKFRKCDKTCLHTVRMSDSLLAVFLYKMWFTLPFKEVSSGSTD
jgi:hypothetical protein